MTGRPRCYVASPFGFTEAGSHYYEHVYLPALRTVVEPVDPWALTGADEFAAAAAGGLESQRALALDVGRRNAEAIRSCAVLAAQLDGQEADSGTVAEVGYACGLGIPCFGLRSDLRQAGEPGVALNLQLEALIAAGGGQLVGSLDALVTALAAHARTLERRRS